jgi:hypothetical protein
VPEIERDLSCADQNGKADAHAKGYATPGTSILGAQITPEIAQEGTSKARFNKEQLDRREAEKGKAVAVWKAAVKEDKLRRRLQAAAAVERRLQAAEEMSNFAGPQSKNLLFDLGAGHTVGTAPVQSTQNCQLRPRPSVESGGAVATVREGRGQQIKRMIIARKSNQARERQKLEMAEAREAAQALRVAEEAERLEEKEEEAKRQRWDKEVTQAIQARWHRVGSLDGEARAWQAQVIRKAKARRQAIRAWDKILTTVETESRRARLAGAGRDAQHRQGQLRKQQEPNVANNHIGRYFTSKTKQLIR